MTKGLERFEVTKYIYFGPGAFDKLKDVLVSLSIGSEILVLTGASHSRRFASSLDLKDDYVESISTSDVSEIARVLELYSRRRVDAVVGIGGGKVLDASKVVAYVLGKPLILMPTTAAHDGIASPHISYILQLDVTRELKIGRVYKVPAAILADTQIILSAPRRYLLAGIGDILGKMTAVRDWMLAHRLKGESFSEFAATLALSSLKMIIKNVEKLKVHDEESVRIVVKSLIGCGIAMSIAGTSRPCSGSEHLISHAIDLISREYGFKPALHGEQVALGTIAAAYLHGLNWAKMKRWMRALKMPTTAKSLGLDRDIIIEALLRAHKVRPDRYTILGDGLTRVAAEQLIDTTGIA